MTIIGHQQQQNQLTADAQQQTVSHAYLFTGPTAVGKFTSALWFAEQLLGQEPSVTSPDVHIVDKLWIDTIQDNWEEIAKSSNIAQKHRAKKPTAKTDTITLEDIQLLQEQLHKSPVGSYRICMIKNIERLNTAAANALLKTIEEPPEKLIFILTSSQPEKLLETIISRCRIISFGKVPDEDLKTLLQQHASEDHQFIKDIANGAPGIIMRCTDADYLAQQKELYNAANTFFISSQPAERLKALEPLQKKDGQQHVFLKYLWLQAKNRQPDTATLNALKQVSAALQTNTSKDVITAYMLQCL